jgi:hypothetical protein
MIEIKLIRFQSISCCASYRTLSRSAAQGLYLLTAGRRGLTPITSYVRFFTYNKLTICYQINKTVNNMAWFLVQFWQRANSGPISAMWKTIRKRTNRTKNFASRNDSEEQYTQHNVITILSHLTTENTFCYHINYCDQLTEWSENKLVSTSNMLLTG